MPDLGKTLSQARVTRGLTLEDCERDTRISKRYLDALEREDWRVFPAPVYSRAFLRTYAQYLGLDPQRLIAAMQAAEDPPAIKPLPEVRAAPTTGAINWPLAGGVAVLLVVAAVFVWFADIGSSGGDSSEETPGASVQGEGLGGGERPGRPVGDVQKGVVPDLAGVSVEAALEALAQAEIDYIIVETDSVSGTPGIVASQDPGAGTKAGGDTSVTLVVPRG
jgi:transcriptional regulator with XRE-family HTH domain